MDMMVERAKQGGWVDGMSACKIGGDDKKCGNISFRKYKRSRAHFKRTN